MFRTTRTAALASLALAVLTGCGGAAAEARGSHTYEPLPPLSTATPTTSPAPQPTSRPAPASSAAPSAEDSSGDTAGAADAAQVGAPSGGTAGASVPGQGAAVAPAPATGQEAAAGQVPAAVAGPIGGGAPVQVTERTSTSTTTTTSTTLEAGLKIVVACKGLCILGDLALPELAGQDGPFSPDLLRQALEEDLRGQSGDQQRLTDELVEQLLQGEWALADRNLEGGDEELVLSSARK